MRQEGDPARRTPSTLPERLAGLGLILLGLVGFGLVYLLWFVAPAAMPAPPGLPRPMLPLLSPLTCALPVMAIASVALIFVGLRKLVLAE